MTAGIFCASLTTLYVFETTAEEGAANSRVLTLGAFVISLVRGAIGGLVAWLMLKGSASRRRLAATNCELASANEQLKKEARYAVQAEERFQGLFSSNPCPMWILDCDTLAFSDVNEAALRQHGYTRQEFLKLSAVDVRPAEEVPRFLARVRSADEGYGFRGVWRHLRKDGTTLLLEICIFRFERGGRPKELVLAQDVTARLEAEDALRKSQTALQSLVNNAPFGIFTSSLRKDCFVDFNPAMAKMLGYSREEMLSLKLSAQVYAEPNDRLLLLDLLRRSGKLDGHETMVLRKDGTKIRVRGWGVLKAGQENEPDALDVYVQDLREQSALEQQVRQVQKLEAVGRLAGGIAHDFNNILVVIRLSAELMLGKVTLDSPLSKPLLQMVNASDRAAALTRQLLAFGRQQVMQSRTINMNSVLSDTLRLLRRTIGEDIRVETRLAEDLENTRLDSDQLGQVIINLAINARDAMPKGGTLHIETQNVELDESYAIMHGPVRAGKYVMIAVSDSGTGIDKAILPRIFDPFFTTKEVGKGTGLGLSIVYGIVKQSGGYIWVYSEPGQGTTFKLYFPITTAQAEPTRQQAVFTPAAAESTIMVVEDEAEIRQNLRECLTQLGYKVLECVNAPDALAQLEKHKNQVDLVITDLIMPGMGGQELAHKLKNLQPQLSLLFISGYTEDVAAKREILGTGSVFLTKPFSVADLSSAVQRALSMRALAAMAASAAD